MVVCIEFVMAVDKEPAHGVCIEFVMAVGKEAAVSRWTPWRDTFIVMCANPTLVKPALGQTRCIAFLCVFFSV